MTFLSKVTIKDAGYAKRNERCRPKEGMPHDRKACQKKKKKKDAYPKKVCHMLARHVKKKKRKEKRKIVHIHGK